MLSTVDAVEWRLSYMLLPHFQHHRLSQITVAEVDPQGDSRNDPTDGRA